MADVTADRCLLCGEPIAKLEDVVSPASYPWELADLRGAAHRDCANREFTRRAIKYPSVEPHADPACTVCKGTGRKWYIDEHGEADKDVCDCMLHDWGLR